MPAAMKKLLATSLCLTVNQACRDVSSSLCSLVFKFDLCEDTLNGHDIGFSLCPKTCEVCDNTTTVTTTSIILLSQSTTTYPSQQDAGALSLHNYYRSLHGVIPLTWNDALVEKATEVASGCRFERSHDDSFSFGVNQYASSDVTNENIRDVVAAWYNEVDKYDFKSQEPSSPRGTTTTGHFTQIVWNNTRGLGCARQQK